MDETSTLRERIARLKRERRAVILAHYYTTPDVQAVADFLGDSLALAVQAQSRPRRFSSRACTSWPRRPRCSAPTSGC